MFSCIWSKKNYTGSIPAYHGTWEVAGEMPVLWGEHCVECAMPDCYKTCNMYVPRQDGRCLRFEHGVQRLEENGRPAGGVHISIRKWGKIEAPLPKGQYGVPTAILNRKEKAFNRIGKVAECFSALFGKWYWHRPSRVLETLFDRYLSLKKWKRRLPLDGFLMVVYNHQGQKTLHVEISNEERNLFHESVELKNGWNEVFYPMAAFRFDNAGNNRMKLYFDKAEGGELTFRTLNFVSLQHRGDPGLSPAAKVKCVAWDLDNTLWSGIIGDVGSENVILNEKSVAAMKELDQRGILQTIVSKNEFEIAWRKIQEAGLADYFLYPAINWGRKSQSLITIAKELNINIDTFAVIDDSQFERIEISHALPQVRVYDVSEIDGFLTYPEFDVPITDESSKRRLSYVKEARRRNIAASWSGDYDDFLRDCRLKMTIRPLDTPEIKARCLELLQRSNQYNISPSRRDAGYLEKIIHDSDYTVYSFEIEDKYGGYGIVGFASVERKGTTYRLADFVMSCRVAQKKAERAFLGTIMTRFASPSDFVVELYKTARNKPLQEELKGMPFTKTEETDSRIEFIYNNTGHRFTEDNIYTVIFE